MAKTKSAKTAIGEIFDWLGFATFCIVGVVLLLTFGFRQVSVDGSSMRNTLEHGDRLIMTPLTFNIENEDIVVISRNVMNNLNLNPAYSRANNPIIKRVIAVEGQTVDINFESGDVYVDGIIIDEPYITGTTSRSFGTEFPLVVSEGTVFVLGDNRDSSLDSRDVNIGLVDTRLILGRVNFRIFPLNRIGGV